MTGDLTAIDRKAWARSALGLFVFALVLFVPAGSLRFWQAWVYGFVFVAGSTVIGLYFLKHDPKLVKRRMRAQPSSDGNRNARIRMHRKKNAQAWAGAGDLGQGVADDRRVSIPIRPPVQGREQCIISAPREGANWLRPLEQAL